jgi:hypothetical protein
MNVVDFCNTHGIPWQPLKLHIPTAGEAGKKKPLCHLGYMAKQSDVRSDWTFAVGEMEYRRRQGLLDHFEHVAIYTTVKQVQIDVDAQDVLEHPLIQKLMRDAPYYKSARKQLPHIFVNIPDLPASAARQDALAFGRLPPTEEQLAEAAKKRPREGAPWPCKS